MKFKVGMRVIYASGHYGDSPSNPLWGGSQGYIVGTIDAAGRNIEVMWDNGIRNGYDPKHLEPYDAPAGNCEDIWT